MLNLADYEVVYFCTPADARGGNLDWVHDLNPYRLTYQIKAEKPEAHVDNLNWSKPESYFIEYT